MISKIIGKRPAHVFVLLSIILLSLGCKNDDAVEQAPDPRPQEAHIVPLGITTQEFISSRSFKGLQEALRGNTSTSWHRNAAPTAEQLLERLNLDSTYYHTAHDMEVLHAPVRTNGSYKRTFLSLSKQDITQAYILTYPDASDHKLYYVSTLGGLLLQKTTINDQGYGSNEVYNTLPNGHAASRASSAGRCYETVYHYCSSGNHSFADGNAMDCEYWGNLGAGTPPTVTTLEYPCDSGTPGGSSGSSGGGWGPSNGGQVGDGGHGNDGFQNVTPPRGGPSILNDCFDVLDCNNCYLYGDLNGDCNIDTYETCLLQGGNYDNGSYCQYDFNTIDRRINGIVYSPVGHTEYVQFMLGMQQSNYTAFLYLLNNETLIEAVYHYFEELGHTEDSEGFLLELVQLAHYEHGDVNNASRFVLEAKQQDKIHNAFDPHFLGSVNQFMNLDALDSEMHDPIYIHFVTKIALLRALNPEWSEVKLFWEATKDVIHISLDVFGLIPVVGEIADLTNGVLYLIDGDSVNATLSFAAAIPFVGVGSTISKYAFKIVASDIGSRVKLVWKVTSDGIDFGASGKLRKVLGLTDSNFQAHHIIPWAFKDNPIIQKAAQSSQAFHMNEALNGIPLHTDFHLGAHPHYNNLIQQRLNAININQTSDEIFDEIVDIIYDVRTAIQNNPTTHINQLTF